MATDATHFDLAVIGAGINGGGIARDAAMRGLKTIVLDKGDICSATSWISSRLIHGGLRYLEYAELPLVYESLHERRCLRTIAPHLVAPLRMNIPLYRGARRGPLLIRLGMLAYDLLSIGKTMPWHKMLGRDQILGEEPGLNADGLRGAARYYDAQVKFAERLVLENLLAAGEAGAQVRTYSEVTAVAVGDASTLTCRDTLTGDVSEVTADVVVNAAGPWVDRVLENAGAVDPGLIGGTKGSHIITDRFPGAPSDAFYVEATSDGRPFFIIPWNDQLLIGTTDLRYDGDLDRVRASHAEVEYLLAETNRVFPQANLGVDGIHYAYAGVRPLPHVRKGPESAITRRHIIKVNDDIGPRFISIIGGKLTTYRHLGQQTVDRVGRILGRRLPACRTGHTPLPGADGLDDARGRLATLPGLSSRGVERLLDVYGGCAAKLEALAAQDPRFADTLDPAGTVLAAEVALAMRDEYARTLEDIVFRRMMIGLSADQGRPLYEPIADIAAAEAGWDDARRRAEIESLNAFSDSLRVS
jgi:glycerol-3-phosphate dehydrogenase